MLHSKSIMLSGENVKYGDGSDTDIIWKKEDVRGKRWSSSLVSKLKSL